MLHNRKNISFSYMYHGFDDDRHVLLDGADVRYVGTVTSQVTAAMVMSQVLPADVHKLRVMGCSKAKHTHWCVSGFEHSVIAACKACSQQNKLTGVCQGLNTA